MRIEYSINDFPPIAMEQSATSWRRGVSAEFGCFKPPSFALADIGSCLDGTPSCLIDFCQNRWGFPSVSLYAPKISAAHRAFQPYRQHWQYAFSSDIKALSSETAELPRRNAMPTTRRKANQGGDSRGTARPSSQRHRSW